MLRQVEKTPPITVILHWPDQHKNTVLRYTEIDERFSRRFSLPRPSLLQLVLQQYCCKSFGGCGAKDGCNVSLGRHELFRSCEMLCS